MEDEEQRGEFRDKLSSYVKVYSFLSQIIPYADPDLEMLYSFGRLLLPHLPLERDTGVVKLGDEVGLQYYRLQRVFSGAIELREGEGEYGVKSPTDVGTGKAKEEKAPLSEIIEVLNDRFGTNFTEEDRLFFEQIKEKATKSPEVVRLRRANPFDKFQLGLRQMLEDLMIQRMGENDRIVSRYMDDKAFEDAAFAVLSRVIYETIPAEGGAAE
jgi:type I restriction enzyme R subunit